MLLGMTSNRNRAPGRSDLIIVQVILCLAVFLYQSNHCPQNTERRSAMLGDRID